MKPKKRKRLAAKAAHKAQERRGARQRAWARRRRQGKGRPPGSKGAALAAALRLIQQTTGKP